ncbi:MAG TPA: sulfur carrier protein ThiS [Armatimonadota bacterium]|jgi:sulfur carrier protein
MDIIVNGEAKTVADGLTVAQLLEQWQIPTGGTAVARNDTVMRKASYADTVLAAGDRIEIIRAVAGG